MDPAKGFVTTQIWLRQRWRDTRLTWNPAAWGGVSTLVLPTDPMAPRSLWVPDISNYYGTTANAIGKATRATVFPDGNVSWSAPMSLNTVAQLNLKLFPYDVQRTTFIFGSWTHTMDQIVIIPWWPNPSKQLEFVSTTGASVSSEFEIDIPGSTSALSQGTFDISLQSFSQLRIELQLKRFASQYTWSVVLPSGLLAWTGWFSFFMPRISHLGARTAVVMTSTLSQITLKISSAKNVPMGTTSWLSQFTTW